MKKFIIIDCQHDFIDGTLACHNAHEAVDSIVEYLKEHPEMEAMYSLDWHKPTNKSFKKHGGIWPDHCVQDTWGARLDERFNNLNQSPDDSNRYYKGEDDEVEEYSAFYAKNKAGKILNEMVQEDSVMIAGIASEFCVMETIKELIKAGKEVTVLESGLGYVDQEGHKLALKKYKELGVTFV